MTKLLATMILSVLLAACSTTDSAKDPNAKVSTTKVTEKQLMKQRTMRLRKRLNKL